MSNAEQRFIICQQFVRGRQEKLRQVTSKRKASLKISLISMYQMQQWSQAERECRQCELQIKSFQIKENHAKSHIQLILKLS